MPAVPKPTRPERGTARCKRHMGEVADTSCACCRVLGYDTPVAELHHPIIGRGAQRRTSDMGVIGLCLIHHHMLHDRRREWIQQFGSEEAMQKITAQMIEENRQRTV